MTRQEVIAQTVDNGFNVHDKYKGLTVEELQQVAVDEALPFRVCALNVEGDLNVGMMARTASLLGVEKFYIFGRRKIDARSLVGAQNYLPMEKISGLDVDGNLMVSLFKDFVEKEHITPLFIEQGGTDISRLANVFTYEDVGKIPCLVFGNEASGIPKEFMEGYKSISIPQRGVLRSYNVAAAASIVMWEFAKFYR